ncbi:hypothetical protein BDW22DRAFT_1335411 [Trametopsis cervina]|nr:hypothetical protein BDW22DRAFT_1335411 [Trametopsis cervina]
MKEAGIKPDAITYEHLLRACADFAGQVEAWAIYDDMVSVGVKPTRHVFHQLLHAMRLSKVDYTYKILDLMAAEGFSMDESTYELVIQRFIRQENLELSLQWLAEMSSYDIPPTLNTIQSVVQLACKRSHAKLAIDIAVNFESTTPRILDAETWYYCLMASADALYPEGVAYAWDKVVHGLGQTLDEGTCIAVLHTTGRHGLKELALDVFRHLQGIGVAWQEHHFAPLVETFAKAGDLREAFATLSVMRKSDVDPEMETAYPIFQAISKNDEKVDEAWAILEDLHKEGVKVDVVAYNTLIQGCVAIGDLQRALGTYKAAEQLNLKPNTETYNLLLSACIAAEHRQLGDRILNDMRDANVKPNERTYERLIVLCLTQATYEDAFFYLEEMKSVNLKPTQAIYEAIVRKCVFVGDTRWHLALEEMQEQEYVVSTKLQTYIDEGGQPRSTSATDTGKDKRWANRSHPSRATLGS